MKYLVWLGAVVLGLGVHSAFAMTDSDYLAIAQASTALSKAGQTDIIAPVARCEQPSMDRLADISSQLTQLEAQADQGAASTSRTEHVRWLNLARDIRLANQNLIMWGTRPLPEFCYVAPGAE